LVACNYATDLFRVVQEALTNVANHAKASLVSVELWEEQRVLRIRIHDDGVGITLEQATGNLAFGLLGIRERIQGLRGDVSIFAGVPRGTTFLASVPFPMERTVV
jgi:signal transduction histidine kinase